MNVITTDGSHLKGNWQKLPLTVRQVKGDSAATIAGSTSRQTRLVTVILGPVSGGVRSQFTSLLYIAGHPLEWK